MTNHLDLRVRIDKAFMKAVDDAIKKFRKKNGKISELQLKQIVIDALIDYKEGIVEALRVNSILENMKEK